MSDLVLPTRAATGSMTAREFALAPADFMLVRSLIRERAGIHLHEGKQAMVYSRLSRRLRDTRHANFDS